MLFFCQFQSANNMDKSALYGFILMKANPRHSVIQTIFPLNIGRVSKAL